MRPGQLRPWNPARPIMPALFICLLALTLSGAARNAAAGEARAADTRISSEQAAQNALSVMPGKVTDVSIERKRGKNVYVVEVVASKDGSEVDVLVDMESGQVLGTE